MPRIHLGWVVLGWMLIAPGLALAQERREVTLDAETPVTVFADRIEHLERERLLIAEGRVEVEQGDTRLEADRVEVNTETGEAVAVGRVAFFDGRDRLLGERLEYNFRTGTGIIYRAEGFAEPHFFFRGDRMERFGEKAYRLTGGWFTTCEAETPAWHVRWGQATAYLDDWIWGTNASFWVWKLPLVPFIPVFAANLRKDRHTGFLTPTFGSSNTKGFTVRQPFFWAISDSQDLLVVPTWYEKRGFGLGGAYRYVRTEGSRGELEGFWLQDTEQDRERWVIGFRHEEQITPRLTLKADVALVSDDQYFSEFGNTLDERSRQRLESNLTLTQRWEKWNLVARLFTYEDLTTPAAIELLRLPEIRLNAFQQPIPWLPGLLYEFESSYVNFVRDVGSEGQRLDLHPRLSYPVSPDGLFTLTPRVGFRETVYDTTVVGTKVDSGFVVEDTESELHDRTLLEAGMDLEARAYRVFELDGLLGIQRLQHLVEPRVSYNYVSQDSQTSLPQFDGIDRIFPTNSLTYSLTNRVKGRAVGTDDRPGRVWELLRLTLSQTWSLTEPRTVGSTEPVGILAPPEPAPGTEPVPTPAPTATKVNRLSSIQTDLIFEPLFGVRFRGTASVDPYEWQLTSATTDLAYDAADWGVTFGTRHGRDGELRFIQGTIRAKLGQRWGARFSTNYDVETGTVIENRLEVDFREQCWAVTVALVDRTNEDEFHITINLLELGHYGFGRVFGAQ